MTQIQTLPHHLTRTLVLGLPLIGSHLAQMSLHVTDTVMLGWYGVAELAAVVLGASLFFSVFILGSGFGIAVMGSISAALGRGDDTEMRRSARMALWLSILYGALAYPFFYISGTVLRALGQDPEIADLAQAYLRIAGIGLTPALIIMVLKSYLAANERTQIVLWVTIAGVVFNAGANYLLIFGHYGAPELGVRGAAYASLLTQSLTALALALYAGWLPSLRHVRLFQRFWRPDWPAFRQVAKLGVPIGLTGVAEAGLFQASAIMMGWVGTLELAAHGIALEITALAFMVHLGLSNAATVRVGRAHGRRDKTALRRASLAAIVLSGAFALAMVGVFLAVPEALVSLFLEVDNPDAARIITFGAMLLAVAALFQVTDAMQALALGLLRGVEDTNMPMWIATISYWLIGMPASYLLAFKLGLGGSGIWYGLVVGLSVAGIALMWRFWRLHGNRAPYPTKSPTPEHPASQGAPASPYAPQALPDDMPPELPAIGPTGALKSGDPERRV
ncbi:MATE family efflux transporter [Albirhodobacter sp. R86504]|uniref:MATE family efflux transporter n=1 Tax=Albirhodobacter sp. R86504 TaxID=3093848 RepID=UPI003672C902